MLVYQNELWKSVIKFRSSSFHNFFKLNYVTRLCYFKAQALIKVLRSINLH